MKENTSMIKYCKVCGDLMDYRRPFDYCDSSCGIIGGYYKIKIGVGMGNHRRVRKQEVPEKKCEQIGMSTLYRCNGRIEWRGF